MPHLPVALRPALCASLLTLVSACGEPPPGGPGSHLEPDPDPLGERVVEQLSLGEVQATPLEHRIDQIILDANDREVTWESCEGVEVALYEVCNNLYESEVSSCWPQATFFYAHDVPRCAVRLSTTETPDQVLPKVLAFDFAGPPLAGPAPTCGNGELDPGEACDDGNREYWDGCDPGCQVEEFQGCEAVIQSEFSRADVAFVDRDAWAGPRSHLMINQGEALRPVDSGLCQAAERAGSDTCDRLSVEMPFVGWCWATATLHDDAVGETVCSVRIEVGFRDLEPSSGVFTTSLNGLLAFTIR